MSGVKDSALVVTDKLAPVTPTRVGDITVVARNGSLHQYDGTVERRILTDADSSGYVTLTPASPARNVIQSTGDFVALSIKAFAGQTGNLQEWLRSDGSPVMYVAPTGNVTIEGGSTGGLLSIKRDTAAGRRLAVQNTDGGVLLSIDDDTSVPALWNIGGTSVNIGTLSIRTDGGNAGINNASVVPSSPFYINHGSIGGYISLRVTPAISGTFVESLRAYSDGGVQIGGTYGTSPGANNLTVDGNVNVRGVTYLWPTANAAGRLRNNGTGTLSWASDFIGAQVYVNGTTGNDSTGLRGYEDFPFLTVEAAYAAMSSGDEIKMFGSVTMSTGISSPSKLIRLNMETGSLLTVATGVTAFADIQNGIRVYGRGAISLVGSAKLITNTGSNFTSIEVNGIGLGNASLLNDYAIDYTSGILYINVASTLSQSSGGVGGFLKASAAALDIRVCGQVSEATSRNTPMVLATSTCTGTIYMGRQQGSTLTAGAAAAPMYDISIGGEFVVAGGLIFGDSPFVRLNTGATGGQARITVDRQTGTGTIVQHAGGRWDAKVSISGGATVQDLFVVDSASGVVHLSGVITAAAGKNAVKVVTGSLEITNCKIYGDVSIADTKTVQMAGARVVGNVKSTSGTGTALGVTPWTATIYPTAAVAGHVPNVMAMY